MSELATVEIEVETPRVPGFLKLPYGAISNQNTDPGRIDIADVPDDVLRKIGERWTENLIAFAGERRMHRANEGGSSVPQTRSPDPDAPA